ncbi:hypothetical protein AABB24_028118, partial [Solanum stoloniferum]
LIYPYDRPMLLFSKSRQPSPSRERRMCLKLIFSHDCVPSLFTLSRKRVCPLTFPFCIFFLAKYIGRSHQSGKPGKAAASGVDCTIIHPLPSPLLENGSGPPEKCQFPAVLFFMPHLSVTPFVSIRKVGFSKRFSSPSSFLFLFPLRFAFPRSQILNSLSPI